MGCWWGLVAQGQDTDIPHSSTHLLAWGDSGCTGTHTGVLKRRCCPILLSLLSPLSPWPGGGGLCEWAGGRFWVSL